MTVARRWARHAGLAGAALGAVAAGVAVERLTVQRTLRRRARLALDTAGPFGTLRGTPGTAVATDGTELYYEIDEIDEVDGVDGTGGGAAPAGTVVFCHGYCLNQDVWHFQRAALRGRVRCVYWDQRSHGRSGRGAGLLPVTVDQLGRDLRAVLDAAVPRGPVVLVGHSMGGMTLMAFADLHPGYVAERVVGTAFVNTSSGGLSELTFGLPEQGAKVLVRMAPAVLRALGSRPELVERGRRATADLFTGLVRRYAFGSPDVDPAVVRFVERLIESVPVDVVAEFFPALAGHEKTAALAAFDTGSPALVITGGRDRMTPSSHGERIAARLRGAELVRLPGAGHLAMLEQPETVTAHLQRLVARTIRTHGRDGRSPDHRGHP